MDGWMIHPSALPYAEGARRQCIANFWKGKSVVGRALIRVRARAVYDGNIQSCAMIIVEGSFGTGVRSHIQQYL
jgi:hypothetical protein